MLNPDNATTCTCQVAQLAKPLGSLQSPMTELLESFAAPTPAERPIVHERIEQLAADMSHLDDEIDRVERVLESLRHKRAALQQLSNKHRNVLNITRHLPVEILGEIFIQWQAMLGGRSIASTQVCRHWRAVAIATSKLWSFIKVSFQVEALEDAEMTRTWLERSGGQPLKLELGLARHHNWWGTDSENPEIFTLLSNQAQRWKNVTIFLTTPMLSSLQNVPENLPILDTLFINGPEYNTELPHSLSNFGRASALRELTLGRRVSSMMPDFHWAQLTRCTLLRGYYTCQDGYHVLSQAINLRSCAIAIADIPDIPTTTLPPLCHANLLSLDLDIGEEQDTQHLLDLLTLPALNTFKIVRLDISSSSLVSFITRSACPLEKLELLTQGDDYTHLELENIFDLIPTVSTLSLQSSGMNQELMRRLMHHPGPQPRGSCCLLPKLTSLELSIHSTLSYEIFADFLSSRCRAASCSHQGAGTAPLHSVLLRTLEYHTMGMRPPHYLPWETYDKFIALRDGGLDFNVERDGEICSLENFFKPGEEPDDTRSMDDFEDEEDFSEPSDMEVLMHYY